MDRRDNRKGKRARKSPRVPLKTYRWEDVRRARKRGGYPWTHLYKKPFDEEVDPYDFTMEAMRKSKSYSTIEPSDRSDCLEIEEIDENSSSRKISTSSINSEHLQIITEPDDSTSNKEDGKGSRPDITPMESADSSDNISQYLDKEERSPKTPNDADVETFNKQERAKSEETDRKRKLSVGSSYSRISLSKLGVLKKLKETKEKIKIPKVSLPVSKIRKVMPKRGKASPPEVKKEVKRPKEVSTLRIDEHPTYIYIPLKPPEGQTDEFSYLEFEEKREPKVVGGIQKGASFRDFVKAVKQLNDAKASEEGALKENGKKEDIVIDNKSVDEKQAEKEIKEIEVKQNEEIKSEKKEDLQAENKEVKMDVDKNDDIKTKPDDLKEGTKDSKEIHVSEIKPVPKPEFFLKNHSDSEEELDLDLDERVITDDSKDNTSNDEREDIFNKLFQASTSRPIPEERVKEERPRAKSAEPERKRKLSLESSYSRKSLSKLAFMKKLKEAKDKISFPKTLSLTKIFKKESKEKKKQEIKQEEKPKKKNLEQPQNVEPVYIHIPLKPPEGKTDEFSYLEFETEKPSKPKLEETRKESIISVDMPDTVQFIYLTAPSDDELLDTSPEIPETPSSTNSKFFANKIDELKELAKDALEKVSPESRRKKLEPVTEENISDKVIIEDVTETETEKDIKEDKDKIEDIEEIKDQEPKSVKTEEIDVEDGLKESQKEAIDLKSSLKGESSPVLKKKVSFKRRAKPESKDDYEEVQGRKLDLSQSMSVDEEKTYLDQKIIKNTSLEEDYSKWSKLSDHEYEPVNPPSEEVFVLPTSQVLDVDKSRVLPISSPPVKLELEDRRSRDVNIVHSEESTVQKSEATEVQEPVPTQSTGAKLQQALKNKTCQFKTRLQSIKKPHITLPNRPKFQKPNLEKFKKNLPHLPKIPKIPDRTTIHLPFNITKKTIKKETVEERRASTEANVGDTKKTFNFSTYPRLFKKKTTTTTTTTKESPSFATVPRVQKETKIRIPLHSEDSMDSQRTTSVENLKEDREDSVERRIREHLENQNSIDHEHEQDFDLDERMPSHIRYDQDIDNDDDYNQNSNGEKHFQDSRWNHGSFNPSLHDEYARDRNEIVTDLDSPEPATSSVGHRSSEGSLGFHRRGVIEEINSDEFFLRQKGISQDNIDVGRYLSSEIREAFRTPANALEQLQYGSNQSLPESQSILKKKPKKPKRKKTPHVSQEQIKYDSGPEDEMEIPVRPKRRSKKRNARSILQDEEKEERYPEFKLVYENEQMEGKEQPEIQISDPYKLHQEGTLNEYENEEPIPPRRQRSLKSLTLSEHDSIMGDFNLDLEQEHVPKVEEKPIRPSRNRSRTGSRSRNTSQPEELKLYSEETPCVEEPCVQDIRDCMGYAIIDKNKARDPPLPPPRTPPRRRRSLKSSSSSETKFSTVPRASEAPPTRPLRNYSTLTQARNSRRNEDKENIDITQYIEIDDPKDLQSGEVLQKMRDRPLPPPPRPPRKTKVLRDITSEENIVSKSQENLSKDAETLEQTETRDDYDGQERIIQQFQLPTHYSHEETVTHASMIVQPLDGSRILPDSQMTKSNERIIPITRDSDDEYTSSIPEEFKNLRNPNTEFDSLKAHKLQVTDLDVDKLTVNELLASKITVAEIDSGSIQASQISTRSGAIKIGEIELPPHVMEELIKKMQSSQQVTAPLAVPEEAEEVKVEQEGPKEEVKDSPAEEKKTSDEPVEDSPHPVEVVEPPGEEAGEQQPPAPPPRLLEGSLRYSEQEDEPQRPPRQADRTKETEHLVEPEVDDEPPPRPPEPVELGYIPSQPPASFYELRAQKYVNENIPTAPRRRRQKVPISRSSSEESPPMLIRRRPRSEEPSIPHLAGQLMHACGNAAENSMKRLIAHIKNNVIGNMDGQQDIHVMMIILLVLIAGLILLGYGEEKTVVHLHHWEYFNPPKDM